MMASTSTAKLLFCLRCSDVLETFYETEIAFHLRISDDELKRTKALFVAKGSSTRTGTLRIGTVGSSPDTTGASRARHYMERKKQCVTAPVTASDCDES
jgi:hypothetical protein